MSTQIIILAAHQTTDSGDQFPRFLTEIDGVSLLERMVEKTAHIPGAKYTYAFLEEDVRKYHLDNVVNLLTPGAQIARIPKGTHGSACTTLLAAADLPLDDEVLILSSNELVEVDLAGQLDEMRKRDADAGTLVFPSIHPRYSFVSLDENGRVMEAAQQNPISRNATTGVFWFRRVHDLISGVQNMIRKGADINGNYYIAPIFNEMVLKGAEVVGLHIDPKRYLPLKTGRQIDAFETSHHALAA